MSNEVSDIKINNKFGSLFNSDARYFILTGGRGSAKSFSITIRLLDLTYEQTGTILFTRYTLTSAEISIIPEFKEKIELLGCEDDFIVTSNQVINKVTGSNILFKGIKAGSGVQTANLKSLHDVTTFVIDEAEELVDEKVFDKIDLSIRKKGLKNRVFIILNPTIKEHWIYKRFFEEAKVSEGYNGYKEDVQYIHTTYLDNIDHLDESTLRNIERIKNNNPVRYQNEILGGWLDAYEGVLFAKDTLNLYTDIDLTKIENMCAYIDVATSKGGDYHCCIVGGIIDKKFYILDVVYTNLEAQINVQLTANLLNKWKPTFCRVESNGVGSLYSSILAPLVTDTQLLNVHTSANKQTRIFQMSGWIKDNVVFKSNSTIDSDYHKFFRGLTTYLMDGSSKNDDAPDATWGIALMAKGFYAESFEN